MHPVAQRVADQLLAQVGYKEDPPESNRTKFAQELDKLEKPPIPRDGSSWCGTFIDWGFLKADALPALVFRNFGTSVAAQHYIAAKRFFSTPQPGDLAFLHINGPGHVGFVLQVGKTLTVGTEQSVEGNTSSGVFGSQSNGGMVAVRNRMQSFWAGFGRPNYDLVQNSSLDLNAIAALVAQYRLSTLQLGSVGPAVSFWQKSVGLQDTGHFDANCVERTKNFQYLFHQRQLGPEFKLTPDSPWLLPITGVVDSHTWACRLDYPD